MSLLSAITSKGHMLFIIKEKGGVNSDFRCIHRVFETASGWGKAA
jgi:hypothetical protein